MVTKPLFKVNLECLRQFILWHTMPNSLWRYGLWLLGYHARRTLLI